MIEAEGLTKRFDTRLAVDDLGFKVEPGEVVALLGPNGAGKSTAMKMLAGYLVPDAGRARIARHDVALRPVAARRALGYLPEGAPGYGEMEVAGFLGFVADLHGLRGPARTSRLDFAVGRLGLRGVLRQPIDTLSKGFRRRVGLAAAVLHDPPVLMLDEPTDGLDPNQKHEVRGLIRELSPGRTILLSTHLLEEVEAIASRALVIAAGRLRADDTPEGLLARSPRHGALSFDTADGPAALAALEGMEGIGECRIDPQDGRVLVLAGARPPDPEAVLHRLAAGKIAIRALRVERGRLDEVFRALTHQALEAA